MIDIHTHILPCLDDGPGSVEESIELCKIAANDGTKKIVATPHSKDGIYEVESSEILNGVKVLNLKLKEAQIDVEILPGAEIHINENLEEYIKNGEVLTINDGMKYVLLEFPFMSVPPGIDTFIFNLKSIGITTILSHAERIIPFQRNPGVLIPLINSGTLVQVTAQSLTEDVGSSERKCAEWLLKHNMVHFIASDVHSLAGRPPILSKALAVAVDILGEKEAGVLVYDNPERVINGLDINQR